MGAPLETGTAVIDCFFSVACYYISLFSRVLIAFIIMDSLGHHVHISRSSLWFTQNDTTPLVLCRSSFTGQTFL
jgi:hypothetical protein